jgi:hypothetical protein
MNSIDRMVLVIDRQCFSVKQEMNWLAFLAPKVNSDLGSHTPKLTTASLANRGVFYEPNPGAGKGFCNNFE